MKKRIVKWGAVLAALLFISVTVMEQSAHARAGGARSMGSRGARSYSQPRSSYGTPGMSRPAPAPLQRPYQQPQSGGFLRGMAGGIMGGLLGGMLFSSLGFAGTGAHGGGGFGLMEILLLAGLGYLVFRMVRKKRTPAIVGADYASGYRGEASPPGVGEVIELPASGVEAGLEQIRRMDHAFEEKSFKEAAMDTFFRIQGAWMNRDLAPVTESLTGEMRQILQGDVARLLQDRQVNRLEQIAVRGVEIEEAWQEMGEDYITVAFRANLLDYTTDEVTGAVISGSKTEPVKFEEFWTFARPVGNNPWRLSAIEQKDR